MTNEQKYKTADERVKAFLAQREVSSISTVVANEFAKWLSIPCDEEKPLPCPFCGANCNLVSVESKSIYFLKCYCGCGYRSGYKSLARAAILEHNRVCRSVEAAKKGDVK